MTIAAPEVRETNAVETRLLSFALAHLRDTAHNLLQAINEKPAQDIPAATPPAAPAPPPE
jgi:hypothetical protein